MSTRHEPDWADRFSRDVESLLNQTGRTDSEPTPTEYRQALALARTLATTDFSAESQVRLELRSRLLNRISTRGKKQQRNPYPVQPFFRSRQSIVILTTVLAVFLLSTLVLAIYPPARVLAQETWQTVLRTVQLIRALPRLTSEALAGLTTSIESPAEAAPLVDFPVRAPACIFNSGVFTVESSLAISARGCIISLGGTELACHPLEEPSAASEIRWLASLARRPD